MTLIAFTSDINIPNEELLIMVALDNGVDYIHIRKPSLSICEVRNFISRIETTYYNRLVIHDYFELATELSLGGIHLNNRNPYSPIGYSGRVSRSCHNINELTEYKHLDYCTLSPIFDSISKIGYASNFSEEELIEAYNNKIIGDKTVALGGVNPQNIEQLHKFGFGGIAVLGYLWSDATIENIKKRVENLKAKI